MPAWLPWSLLPALLVGVLGALAVNGVVHRLVGIRRLRLLGEDAFVLQGLEGWEVWLALD